MANENISILKNERLRNRKIGQIDAQTSSADHRVVSANLPKILGNRAIQRLIARRGQEDSVLTSFKGAYELDEETADHISRERSCGQALDSNLNARISDSTGQDFSDVKIHTGAEANSLNEQLNAKAFTTGSDIFFRDGAYNPNSSSGQELLAHELTHVVQQRSGAVGRGNGRMTVNAPGDRFEQEADAVAKAVTSQAATPEVQRQIPEEEDEEVQTKFLQREALPEEEDDETLQRQELDEDEDELND